MLIVIPLGGIGKRFADLGYTDPKPLIKVLGKEIIFWVLDNLKLSKNDKVYIVYNKILDDHNFINFFGKYPYVNFLKLDFNTRGPVETIYQLTKILDKSEEINGLMIIDGDTFYKKNILKSVNKKKNTIFYHKTNIEEPIFSYLKLKKNKVIQIAEKVKISNNANTGAYYFNNLKKFNDVSKKILIKNKKAYVSDIYKNLLKNGELVLSKLVSNNEFACLGTPKQVTTFCKNTNLNKKIFCFDLDNTLVTFPRISDDYNSVRPIEKNIRFLNFLKFQGHYIIINTARRMRTHKGDVKKAKKEIEKLTKKQLKKFNIKYDKLIFGKPYANYYIDDLAVNPRGNLNIKLGFYEKKNDISREFNELTIGEKFTIKYSKNLHKLNAEINYFKSIPKKINFLFPKLISCGKDWYKMETVNGTKLSYLLINNLLTKNDIRNLLDKISLIHNSKINLNLKKNDINIYNNYSQKMRERVDNKVLKMIGYKIFKRLDNYLKNYEDLDKGSAGVIHGDIVMSNIIKKYNGDIIFLDPRGSLHNKYTIYGDINYDLAKIYQSLTGYENIIMDKYIDEKYLENLRNYYENLLKEKQNLNDISIIKKITSSFYLTLLNFHDEKYKFKFIDKALSLI